MDDYSVLGGYYTHAANVFWDFFFSFGIENPLFLKFRLQEFVIPSYGSFASQFHRFDLDGKLSSLPVDVWRSKYDNLGTDFRLKVDFRKS